MKQFIKGLFGVLLLAILLSACTDPTNIGSELLEDDQANVDFSDTITIKASTVIGDTIRTYSPIVSSQLEYYLFGDMKDPVFGQAKSSLYVQPRPNVLGQNFTMADDDIDSIILVLPYDTLAFYGIYQQLFKMNVFQVEEDISRDKEYYSDQDFATSVSTIGAASFFPNLDSIEIVDYGDGSVDTVLAPPHLRIALDNNLKSVLLSPDTSLYLSDSAFISQFKGIYLSPGEQGGGLISFDLFSLMGGIYVYYQQDGLPEQAQYGFKTASVRIANFEHDYTGTLIEPFIDQPDKGDSLAFVQGLEGLNIELDFPHVESLKGVIVNKAELIIPIHQLEGDNPDRYSVVEQLLVSKKTEEDKLIIIEDVALAGGDLSAIFGGVVIDGEGDNPDFYRLNISAHFQDMIDGVEESKIVLTSFPKPTRAYRTIINGVKHPTDPIKLRLAFTKL